MQTSKINGRNCRELAEELAKIVGKSVHFNAYGYVLTFDEDDAEELRQTAEDAGAYWFRIGKRAKGMAADAVRERISEAIISERYSRTFAV